MYNIWKVHLNVTTRLSFGCIWHYTNFFKIQQDSIIMKSMILFRAPLYTYHYNVNIISITFRSLAYFMCVLFSLSYFYSNFQMVTIKCSIFYLLMRKKVNLHFSVHKGSHEPYLSIYLYVCEYINII